MVDSRSWLTTTSMISGAFGPRSTTMSERVPSTTVRSAAMLLSALAMFHENSSPQSPQENPARYSAFWVCASVCRVSSFLAQSVV